jgi:hypothetical protein
MTPDSISRPTDEGRGRARPRRSEIVQRSSVLLVALLLFACSGDSNDHVANVHLDGEGHLVITPLRDSSYDWTSGRFLILNVAMGGGFPGAFGGGPTDSTTPGVPLVVDCVRVYRRERSA